MTVTEVAEVLGVSENAVRLALKLGQIPSLKIGRNTLIPRVAIEKMLACKLPAQSPDGEGSTRS